MADYIVNAITSNGAIRVVAADTTQLCNRAQEIHKMSPTAAAALGRTLTAAAIMGSMLKSADDSLTIQLNGGGPIGKVVAVGDGNANVKGYVGNPLVDLPLNDKGKLDVGGAIGKDGMLGIIRDLGLKEPYIGQVPLVNGEVAEDLTQYYATSEQLPTAVALGVLVDVDYTIKAAGGFILQVLPGAYDEDIDNVEKTIASISSVTEMLSNGKKPEDIVEQLLSDYEIEYFDNVSTQYKCDCSRERTDRALISLGKDELAKIINEDGKAEITCHFCDNIYKYTKEELEQLLESAK
ncbi:MAG: Hsp33 family molecular chaperone HslO [Ruminococcaceae bacterium]|nr:Hsp33 family molecular chaperone HslO [Oscillospiraceae bacterium]